MDPVAHRAAGAKGLARAAGHTLWYVYSPLYITHPKVCVKLSQAFARVRTPTQRIASARKALERPLLQEFPATASGR